MSTSRYLFHLIDTDGSTRLLEEAFFLTRLPQLTESRNSATASTALAVIFA